MKTWMFALLGVAPNLLAWNYAVAQEPCADGQSRVIVMTPAQAAGGDFKWVSSDGAPQVTVVARSGANGELEDVQVVGGQHDIEADVNVIVMADAQDSPDGRSQKTAKKVKVLARSSEPDAANRGWLGVSIESVPDAVAAQSGRTGVMVGNVVEGSPADTGGIQANDMITSINGEAVGNDVGPAVDLIKSRKPGETINVGLLRGGQPLTAKVTLGSRADMKGFNWKFEGLPSQIDEEVKTRGKFMLRGPDGELIVKDLGDLDDLKNLPDNIRMFVPQSGSRSTQVFVENGQKTIKTHIEIDNDGSSLNIEQTDGGPITVTRTDAQGEDSVATYDNADALKAADEEAYDIYSSMGSQVFVHVDGDDADGAPHIFLRGGDGTGEWRMHLEQSLAEAKEAYGAAMEELHANMMELKNQGTFDFEKFHEMLEAQGAGKAFTFRIGKAVHSFSVNPDGSIDATIRKGDSEVVQKFLSESDLANRRPDLYEKYQDVKADDEE